MQINDEDCIRYLMREMDPSEEIEFEREMMSNENLLIEVEILRSTYNKVKKLPLKQPPTEILDKIREQAVSTQKKNIRSSLNLFGWLGKAVAVAATLLLLLSSGFYFFEPVANVFNTTENNAQVLPNTSVQPWVDRNQVIKVSDRIDAIKAQNIGDDYEKSYDKLILINQVESPAQQRQGVLLTSSPVNRD